MSAITGSECSGSNFLNQTQLGSKNVQVVTPLGTFSVPSKTNYADEWARFLHLTDVSSRPGQQNVSVYTIDVFKDHQDADETALLFNMAKFGGGKYFQASNESAIVDALKQIMIEIQSVNTVFASASLPINATNRSQNENQVFIGMFRPDGSGSPRWYGNLTRYQIADVGGGNFKLADASSPPLDAVSVATGFVQPCAKSFWTVDSGDYWLFQNGSAGECTTSGLSLFSDSPDGPAVEKGAVAEVLRRGNDPSADSGGVQSPMPGVNRTIYTCMNSTDCCTAPASCGGSPATEMVPFNITNVSKAELGNASMADLEQQRIIDFTTGVDVDDDNQNSNATDVRPGVHGDVAHSRPLPVNYGTPNGVVLYYGANDGTFRAVSGSDGKELWAFIAPEHHSKLKRLLDKSPLILYPNQDPVPAGATSKDYFFDGSAGLFQNADSSKVWVFPTMRRGGRMLYAFDVSDPTTPALKWRIGCSNADMADTSSCTPGFEQMGQTWSIPAVTLIKGFSTDVNTPVIIIGGGYDSCEDEDVAPNAACTTSHTRRGNRVYVINADTGALVKEFATNGSVPSDVTLVDRDFDGFADHAYATTTTGYIYRIDFVDPLNVSDVRASSDWTISEVAHTTSTGNRKFLFGPAVLPSNGKMFVTTVSGDRERPLIVNYPFETPITNRAYMVVDSFNVTTDPDTGTVTGTPVNLDDTAQMSDLTTGSDCSTATPTASGMNGWFFDLNNGTGEQGVTSSTIFAGLVFFSTNRPLPTPKDACANELGEARGYAVNLLNASGAVGTQAICGADRSGVFVGGGLPPSPVTGTVPVNGRPITVMIGGIDRSGGISSPIGAQRVKPTITQKRSRLYIYNKGEE
jgi:Tfp pilus tip-associated adhesin PilY1